MLRSPFGVSVCGVDNIAGAVENMLGLTTRLPIQVRAVLVPARLIEVRHKLVEQCCTVAINDAKARRVVPTIFDPWLCIRQRSFDILRTKGSSRINYLAGRVHLDYEQR
jgi:hypothetical protein